MSGSCGWRCQCVPGLSQLSGGSSYICRPPGPTPPHWCCTRCTTDGSGGSSRRCCAHPHAPPVTDTSGLWGSTVSALPPVWRSVAAATTLTAVGDLGCSTVRVRPNHRHQTVTVLASPAVGQSAAMLELNFSPPEPEQRGTPRPGMQRWAIIMPNTAVGSVVPLLPHRRDGPTPTLLYHSSLSSLSWTYCSMNQTEVLPGLSYALYDQIKRSPCASERWWMCSGALLTDHMFAARPHEPGMLRLAGLPPVVIGSCPYPVSALRPVASQLIPDGPVTCGRCNVTYPNLALYQAGCAPDSSDAVV